MATVLCRRRIRAELNEGLLSATRQNLGLNDDPAPADRRVLLPIADRRAASANKALLPPGPQAARLLPVFFTF